MSTTALNPPSQGEPFTVTIETVAWVNSFLGSGGASRRFEEPATPGECVRDILVRFANRYPKLKEALWEGREIGPHIEIIINNVILGEEYTLDSPLKEGDEIMLMGQYIGG